MASKAGGSSIKAARILLTVAQLDRERLRGSAFVP